MKKITIIITAALLLSISSFGQMMHGNMYQDTTNGKNMMHNQGMMNQNGMGNSMMMPYGMGQGMMMGHNMMGNMHGSMYPMMGNCPWAGNNQQMPMQKYQMLVNNFPSMQQQLNLTSDQESKLIDLRSEYLKKKIDWQASLQKERMKLNELLKSDAAADAVQKQIEACTTIKTTIKVEAYKTVMAMKKILNSDQLEKLNKSASYCQNNNMMDKYMTH